jgi:hypothetical protein
MVDHVRSEVLTAVSMISITFLDVTPRSLEIVSFFIGLLFDLEDGGSTFLQNLRKLFIRLHGITCEKITPFNVILRIPLCVLSRGHIVPLWKLHGHPSAHTFHLRKLLDVLPRNLVLEFCTKRFAQCRRLQSERWMNTRLKRRFDLSFILLYSVYVTDSNENKSASNFWCTNCRPT